MISADVIETMQKILPVKQNLIPVSVKKKLEYGGHYIQEYVDKEKVKVYFEWFKKYNHIFANYDFNESIITDYENKCMDQVAKMDAEKAAELVTNHNVFNKENIIDMEELESEEELEETVKIDKEIVQCEHSSIIQMYKCTKKMWMPQQLLINLLI